MERVPLKNLIYHCEYYRDIMFQLPQKDIYRLQNLDSRNWNTCLLLYALRDAYKSRDEQQLYGAKTVKILHPFLMQRIDYILTKKWELY